MNETTKCCQNEGDEGQIDSMEMVVFNQRGEHEARCQEKDGVRMRTDPAITQMSSLVTREDGREQEPRGSKDATTLSSLIVHFLLFFVFDGRIDRRTDIWMSFLNCL